MIKTTSIDGVSIETKPEKILPKNYRLYLYSRQNRKKGILSEVLFWYQVRNDNFFEIDFHRQIIIGNYIVDFYVPSLWLIIEIDGSSHIGKFHYDNQRVDYFKSLGLFVYKTSDQNIKHNLQRTMLDLKDFIIENFGIK